ncbi:MAG TPA: hypothetical protein VEK08_10435 [Planctomycetota bacterium]|nr:hypothetical protein [Planctomycetota bacterium]
MKIAITAVAVLAILCWVSLTVLAAPKESVELKGEIVDLHCYLDREAKGAGHKQCAVQCAKAGNPIALLTDKGDLYLLMGEKKHQTSNDMLIEKISDIVTITGTQVKKGGLQAVYVSKVK